MAFRPVGFSDRSEWEPRIATGHGHKDGLDVIKNDPDRKTGKDRFCI